MAKTLVIVAHPTMDQSVINKRWVTELEKRPDQYTIHQLYDLYPDYKIDVEAEQKLMEQHDSIVFQFPVQWFSTPPLLKQWLDDVLAFGWAYGPGGDKLKGKRIGIAVSFGQPAESYNPDGLVGYTVTEVLRPMELIFEFVGAQYQPIFSFHVPDFAKGYDEESLKAVDYSANSYAMHMTLYYLN